MKLRVFTLRYDAGTQHFDDAPLRLFFDTDVDAVEVRDHVLTCDGQPVLVLLVSYRDASVARLAVKRDGPSRDVAKQDLCAEEVQRFEAMRAWRNERAHRDGKPGEAGVDAHKAPISANSGKRGRRRTCLVPL